MLAEFALPVWAVWLLLPLLLPLAMGAGASLCFLIFRAGGKDR